MESINCHGLQTVEKWILKLNSALATMMKAKAEFKFELLHAQFENCDYDAIL